MQELMQICVISRNVKNGLFREKREFVMCAKVNLCLVICILGINYIDKERGNFYGISYYNDETGELKIMKCGCNGDIIWEKEVMGELAGESAFIIFVDDFENLYIKWITEYILKNDFGILIVVWYLPRVQTRLLNMSNTGDICVRYGIFILMMER